MSIDKFNTLGDFLSSSLYTKISETQLNSNTRVLSSSRLENMIYHDLRRQVDSGLNELEALGTEKLDTFPSLIQDTFQSLYSLNPKRNDVETLTTNARKFNAEILDHAMTSSEYPTLKSLCEGRELPAYEAVSEFSECLFEKMDKLLEMAGGDKNSLNVLNKLERQQAQLQEKIKISLENELNGQKEKDILDLVSKIESKERQIERLSDMISQNMRKNTDTVQAAVISAVLAAEAKAKEVSDIIMSWGSNESNPEALTQNADLLKRVHSSPKLRDIAKYLGRYKEILENAQKNGFAYGRGDKYDITLGNDYSRAVSSEYAYLAIPDTVPLFIQKVQKKALKQYRKRERISKGYGDIVVCIDESTSMKGESISWAKAVALTLLEFAMLNRKSCGIVRFSSEKTIKQHLFQSGKYSNEDIFNFAESFLGGGTDFEAPLKKGIDLIENNSFQAADIVFLTDGECVISDKFAEFYQKKSKTLNFKTTGIVMDKSNPGMTFSLTPFCNKVYRLSEITVDALVTDILTNL